ncbi:MAG: molybdopterin-dependent oxidoreductase [Deltaproteobacteria bacterium]|nr:molybdopterin-dependent oxidoreductase [Deltaproteobacteria bacterium]
MKKHTICRLCSSCCPVTAYIEKGRLISAHRNSDLPEERQLICPKLKAAPDIVYSPRRLSRPLLKDRDTGFREASWDEALDNLAERFLFFKNTFGAESVCWLRGMAADWGAPWDYVNRLMNTFGSPNSIGNGSVCHVGRELAHTVTYGAMTMPLTSGSRCIMIWGKNDTDTNPGAAENILNAREKGAVLIVIDPVKTLMAEKADIWLQIKPAHDGLLAMAMINEIISKNYYNASFIEKWTTGFEQLSKAAEPFSPEKIAGDIGLDPEMIREAARLYATTAPACIVDGNGLDMQLDTFDATRSVCMLRALTGNLDIKGGDFIPQPVRVRNIQLRDRIPGHVQPITRDYGIFNNFHETWGRHVQSCLIDAILDEKPYPVKMVVSQAGNPAVTMMDANRVKKAFEKLDFLVVIDMFMTRTAHMADIVLPASSCFEKTQLNRAFIRNSPVRIQDAVIEPLGDSWPDWRIIFELGRRLGLEAEFPWQTAENAINYQLEPAGITVEMLRDHPEGIRADETVFRKYRTSGFNTPSGKVEFYSGQLSSAGFSGTPYMNGYMPHPISFDDRKDSYPLVGISGARINRFTHTQFHQINSLARNNAGCVVDIHKSDANAYGIVRGDMVRLETPRGWIQMKAEVNETVPPGVIRIAWGWGDIDPECSLNRLTDDERRNPVTGTPSGRTFMCRISKIKDSSSTTDLHAPTISMEKK